MNRSQLGDAQQDLRNANLNLGLAVSAISGRRPTYSAATAGSRT